MKLNRLALVALLGMTGSAMLANAADTVPAKPESSTQVAAKQPSSKANADASAKKSRRLPAGYGMLGLNDGQREQIYGVQASYQNQIDKLRDELAQLTAQRDSKLEAVLTPGQRARLNEMRAESKAKSEKAAAAAKTSK